MAYRVCAGVAVLLLGLSAPPGAQSLAASLAAPSGPVVLTIAGQIGVTNRGAVDALHDSILAYHEKSFEAAAEFDRAMLEGLGTHEIELTFEEWPEAYRFSGPKLVDVLAAAGAQGRPITVTALDGYAEEISADELVSRDWIVALDRNGSPLGIGGRGPLWIVYAIPGNAASHDDESRWPWAAFFIEVH